MGDNLDKKKSTGHLFFMKTPNKKFQNLQRAITPTKFH